MTLFLFLNLPTDPCIATIPPEQHKILLVWPNIGCQKVAFSPQLEATKFVWLYRNLMYTIGDNSTHEVKGYSLGGYQAGHRTKIVSL